MADQPKPKPKPVVALVGIDVGTKRYEAGDPIPDLPPAVCKDYLRRGRVRKER